MPRITSRWPRWTPSKVPIATRRVRSPGSTSGSGVTFTGETLCPGEYEHGLELVAARLGDGEELAGVGEPHGGGVRGLRGLPPHPAAVRYEGRLLRGELDE